MRPLIQEIPTGHTPESLVERLQGEPGIVLLRSALFDSGQARHSFVAAKPFLTLRAFGSRCELLHDQKVGEEKVQPEVQFGNPWQVLDGLMARYELLDEMDLPFPLGGCFGYWGYDLKNFVEPKLPRRAVNDLDLPDCHVGFYGSLVAFDHQLGKAWIVATGLGIDGSRSEQNTQAQYAFWRLHLDSSAEAGADSRTDAASNRHRKSNAAGRLDVAAPGDGRTSQKTPGSSTSCRPFPGGSDSPSVGSHDFLNRPCAEAVVSTRKPQSSMLDFTSLASTFARVDFLGAVERAQRYIRAGDIYQVNLAQRLAARCELPGWELYQRLAAVSPAPFSAYLDCGGFQVASSSPELFLRLSGSQILTRPIKGTRPRSSDATRDAQFTYELQTSPKEMAELVMITDLLRNDLGRVCEYGSVQVPELVRLERYPQVQHLVSTVEGCLRPGVTHFAAFASCFPGGSITGAPKIRAMEIIDELEPVTRGPYTGAIGYLGFNRESQLSIAIRSAIVRDQLAYFHAGAGIVADSIPAAEYEETLAKARGFLAALELSWQADIQGRVESERRRQ